jgi:hypothetical protein
MFDELDQLQLQQRQEAAGGAGAQQQEAQQQEAQQQEAQQQEAQQQDAQQQDAQQQDAASVPSTTGASSPASSPASSGAATPSSGAAASPSRSSGRRPIVFVASSELEALLGSGARQRTALQPEALEQLARALGLPGLMDHFNKLQRLLPAADPAAAAGSSAGAQ